MIGLNGDNREKDTSEKQLVMSGKLTFPALICASVLTFQVQAGNVLEICDSNGNGVIDTHHTHGFTNLSEAPKKIRNVIIQEELCRADYFIDKRVTDLRFIKDKVNKKKREIYSLNDDILKNLEILSIIEEFISRNYETFSNNQISYINGLLDSLNIERIKPKENFIEEIDNYKIMREIYFLHSIIMNNNLDNIELTSRIKVLENEIKDLENEIKDLENEIIYLEESKQDFK